MISVLTPSRGRPEQLFSMVLSSTEKKRGKVEHLVYLDKDDPELDGYPKTPDDRDFGDVIIGPPIKVGRAWNILAMQAKGDLLMMGNDDLVFRTEGWDLKIEEAVAQFEDGIFVAWCDDGAPRPSSRCCFPIVSRKWFETLGYFTPEFFHFLWNDTYIHDVGRMVGRCLFIENVLIEHLHFSFGKSERDATYQRHRVGPENAKKRREDMALFRETKGNREADADLLMREMSGGKL